MRVNKEEFFQGHYVQEFKYIHSGYGYCYIQMYLNLQNVYVINFQKKGDCHIVECENYEDAKQKFIAAVKKI